MKRSSLCVVEKTDALVKNDEKLSLYTLVSLKNRKDVHYLKPFGGTSAENVFEFVENIQQAWMTIELG